MLKNLSIKARIWIVLGIVAFFMALLIFISLRSLFTINNLVAKIVEVNMARERHVALMTQANLNIIRTINMVALHEDINLMNEDRQKIAEYRKVLDYNSKALIALTPKEDVKAQELLENIARLTQEARPLNAAAMDLGLGNKTAAVRKLLIEKGNPKNEESLAAKITLGEYLMEQSTMQLAEAQKSYAFTRNELLVLGFLLMGLGIGTFLWLGKSITQPLDVATARLRDIAEGEGDLTKRLNLNSKDEIGVLGGWLDKFIEKVHNNVVEISKTGDHVGGVTQQIELIARNIASAAEKTSQQSGMIASSATQMNQNLQVVSSAIEEMSISVAEVAKKASESAGIASQANKISANTTAVVRDLGERAKKIGAVIESIAQIAAQTNLLALNAAIEAAGAGDSGKGFAVVASEVKELARQAADSSENIKDSVEQIQSTTDKTVGAMEDISQVIIKINEISSSIASAVEEQSITAKDIARNVQQTSLASSEVNKSIDGINQGAMENAKEGSQGKELVDRLKAQVDNLNRVVNQFKFHRG